MRDALILHSDVHARARMASEFLFCADVEAFHFADVAAASGVQSMAPSAANVIGTIRAGSIGAAVAATVATAAQSNAVMGAAVAAGKGVFSPSTADGAVAPLISTGMSNRALLLLVGG